MEHKPELDPMAAFEDHRTAFLQFVQTDGGSFPMSDEELQTRGRQFAVFQGWPEPVLTEWLDLLAWEDMEDLALQFEEL